MTSREWHEADQDDADRVRAWPAQDAQEPNEDFEQVFVDWKIEALEEANEQLRADLREAWAQVANVRSLVGALVGEVPDPKDSTHWDVCHRRHRDCLVLAIRAALEVKP